MSASARMISTTASSSSSEESRSLSKSWETIEMVMDYAYTCVRTVCIGIMKI